MPDWHYLLTGNRDAMRLAGASAAGRCISETVAGPLEHHIIEWDEPDLEEADWDDER